MQAISALKKKMLDGEEGATAEDLVPTRLEQALANMVEKVIARQRLGQCKAQVRNQSTMEARDALRKLGLPKRNHLDEEHFTAMITAFGHPPGLRNDADIATIMECLQIMRCLDDFCLPEAILATIVQGMTYEVLRVRDRVIMEGEEMDGVFKLCLAGIMQSDIDEYKNALYLETGEFFCEEYLRAHVKNNPEPLVMMVTKQETHLVTVRPEHYLQFLAPYFHSMYEWKKEFLMTIDLFNSYSDAKLNSMAAVAGKCSFRAGEPIVVQGRTGLKRYLDTYDGILFILKGEVAVFKQVEPTKREPKQSDFLDRLDALSKGRASSVPIDCSPSAQRDARKNSTLVEDGSKSKRGDNSKDGRRVSIVNKTKGDIEEVRAKRRQSISDITKSLSHPGASATLEGGATDILSPSKAVVAPPPVPKKPPSNKMGGKGELYENMLMPLDDMKYGPEFKLATVSLKCTDLRKLIDQGNGEEGSVSGLQRVREGNVAVVMVPNPGDYDNTATVHIYVKGHPVEVDKALSAIRVEVNVTSVLEVNPYAPASKLVPIAPEHVEKVRSIMLEVAQQTTTEITFTTPKCQVLKIVGREGDCNRALEQIQSQLDKKMWTVQVKELRPGQSFGEAAYMEGDHPHHESYIRIKKPSSEQVHGIWKQQSVIALTHVECLVLTANDFGDMITRSTHEQVCDQYHNNPTDESLQKTLKQYAKWDRYKRTLVEELHQYYEDPKNFGLPIHMPEMVDDTNGEGYLHMYVKRKGPEKRKAHRTKPFSVESMHPPKIGVDHFSQK